MKKTSLIPFGFELERLTNFINAKGVYRIPVKTIKPDSAVEVIKTNLEAKGLKCEIKSGFICVYVAGRKDFLRMQYVCKKYYCVPTKMEKFLPEENLPKTFDIEKVKDLSLTDDVRAAIVGIVKVSQESNKWEILNREVAEENRIDLDLLIEMSLVTKEVFIYHINPGFIRLIYSCKSE